MSLAGNCLYLLENMLFMILFANKRRLLSCIPLSFSIEITSYYYQPCPNEDNHNIYFFVGQFNSCCLFLRFARKIIINTLIESNNSYSLSSEWLRFDLAGFYPCHIHINVYGFYCVHQVNIDVKCSLLDSSCSVKDSGEKKEKKKQSRRSDSRKGREIKVKLFLSENGAESNSFGLTCVWNVI